MTIATPPTPPPTALFGHIVLVVEENHNYASILGNSLTVSNRNANLSVSQISKIAGLHRATLDMRELNTFNCVVSKVLVGHNFTQPDFAWRPTGELYLAKTNSITAGVISVSDAYQNAGAACFIHLGSSSTLNVDKVRIGMHKCVGFIDFTPGVINPSVTFRNKAGTGRQMSWELGDEFDSNTNLLFGFFTSNQARGTMDLTGATVDAMVDRIILGRGQIQVSSVNRTGDGNGTLTFGGGTIDANYIEMGIQVPGPFIGGSVGHGILNVNNDAGVGPALLTVRSNLVMAVQQPGSTDATGSTADININGGTVAVAGDIVEGGGLSTININAGGKLNLEPAGDATPGNVSVHVLNITDDGIITNYATLSTTNINLLGSASQFTVDNKNQLTAAPVPTSASYDSNGRADFRHRKRKCRDQRLTKHLLVIIATLTFASFLSLISGCSAKSPAALRCYAAIGSGNTRRRPRSSSKSRNHRSNTPVSTRRKPRL